MTAITINVEIGFQESAYKALEKLALIFASSNAIIANPSVLNAVSPETQKPAPATAPAKAEEPAKDPTIPDSSNLAPGEDLPVSEADLRNAVKEARHRGATVATVKALFNEFGIANSSECPEDRREELYNRLQVL